MNNLLFSYLGLNSVLSFDHPEKLTELMELVKDFNSLHGTNFDPINKSLEYMNHDSNL